MNSNSTRFLLLDHASAPSAATSLLATDASSLQDIMANNQQQLLEHTPYPLATHFCVTRTGQPVIRSRPTGEVRSQFRYQADGQQFFDRTHLSHRSHAGENNAAPTASRSACPICSGTFSNEKELRNHVTRVHRLYY